jgi:hypothetical protein
MHRSSAFIDSQRLFARQTTHWIFVKFVHTIEPCPLGPKLGDIEWGEVNTEYWKFKNKFRKIKYWPSIHFKRPNHKSVYRTQTNIMQCSSNNHSVCYYVKYNLRLDNCSYVTSLTHNIPFQNLLIFKDPNLPSAFFVFDVLFSGYLVSLNVYNIHLSCWISLAIMHRPFNMLHTCNKQFKKISFNCI